METLLTCESISTSYLQSDNFTTNRLSWSTHFAKIKTFISRLLHFRSWFLALQLSLAPGVIVFLFVCLLVLETQALPHSINLTQFHLGYFLWNYSSGKTAAVVSATHSSRTEEMSRDYLIHTNTEAGSKRSPVKQMADCAHTENSQESRFQNICMQHLLVVHQVFLKIQALEVRYSSPLPPLPSW